MDGWMDGWKSGWIDVHKHLCTLPRMQFSYEFGQVARAETPPIYVEISQDVISTHVHVQSR